MSHEGPPRGTQFRMKSPKSIHSVLTASSFMADGNHNIYMLLLPRGQACHLGDEFSNINMQAEELI